MRARQVSKDQRWLKEKAERIETRSNINCKRKGQI